jgi:stage V sporulation protein AD
MNPRKKGKQTVEFLTPPSIKATAAIGGPKEGKGPLGRQFDKIIDDEKWGEKSWEKAESKLVKETLAKLFEKAGASSDTVDFIIGGDLLNQCVGTTYGLRGSNIPLFGIFGACSTIGEAMAIGSMLIDGGFAENIAGITSSHFCTAEKQFRLPLEQGSQRPPTAQWTVTASGGVFLTSQGNGPYITRATIGKIVDLGIKDSANMGSAMAPAAADTIFQHFKETGLPLDYYDLIITGDLGSIGSEICGEILAENHMNLTGRLNDCGLLIYDMQKQDPHAGGSGCGCAASVFASHLYNELILKKLERILFIPTGALMSPTSVQQGESIPGIAHAIAVEGYIYPQ